MHLFKKHKKTLNNDKEEAILYHKILCYFLSCALRYEELKIRAKKIYPLH